MRARTAGAGWLLIVLVAGGCRETKVEVSTEVGMLGEASRSVRIHSFDGEEPADHPDNLVRPGGDYRLVNESRGLLEFAGSFARLEDAGPAFGFRSDALDARSGDRARVVIRDWLLFKQYVFSEQISDVVDPDGVQAALEEAVGVGLGLLEASFQEAFGEEFDDTVLRERLSGDLRKMAREGAFLIWRELQRDDSDMIRSARRLAQLLARYGLELEVAWFEDALEYGEDSDGWRSIRRALAAWVEDGLRPREKEGRVLQLPHMETFLFEGPFTAVLSEHTKKRFGSLEAAERYRKELDTRVFGLFGSGAGDLTFVLRVKLPGELLRSEGYLGREGWTFIELPARAVYPNGGGLVCESVVWDYGALGALAVPGLLPDNETALDWMLIVSSEPDSGPQPLFAEAVKECIAASSVAPLEARIEALERDDERRAGLERVLDWLKGRRE